MRVTLVYGKRLLDEGTVRTPTKLCTYRTDQTDHDLDGSPFPTKDIVLLTPFHFVRLRVTLRLKHARCILSDGKHKIRGP